MDTIKKIVVAILLLSFTIFVALFGRLPALRKTPVGFLHRLLLNVLPGLLRTADIRITGGRITTGFRNWSHYLMNENHPIVLIFYLVIMFASEALFLSAAFVRIQILHKMGTFLACSLPYIFTYKAVKSKSSFVTPENHSVEMRRYPYDHVLYQPGNFCRTCHFPKPARSKHCSICRACVAKHDHHCVWVMNCLGKDNYVYFVALMASLGFLLSYGSYLAYLLLNESLQADTVQSSGVPMAGAHWSVGKTWRETFHSWIWAFSSDVRIGGVGMLAMMTAPLGWGLFFYHLYLIWAGMTTSESSKWADWRDDISDGFVFRSEREPGTAQSDNIKSNTEPNIEWPISSTQHLVSTDDGRPPGSARNGHSIGARSPPTSPTKKIKSQPRWQQVQSLAEVDNLYDLGFWGNFLDVLPS